MKTHSLLTILMTSFLISHASARAEGNGGGYNGPVLWGSSIPIETDRAITDEDVTKVTGVCGRPVAVALFEQVFRKKFKDFGSGALCHWPSSATQITHSWTSSGMSFLSALTELSSRLSCKLKFDRLQISAIGTNLSVKVAWEDTSNPLGFTRDYISEKEVKLDLEVAAPHFQFDTIASEPRYDDWGNVILDNGPKVAKNIRLVLPAEFGERVRLRNAKTDQLVRNPIDVNLVKYADCLKTQIQK